jgi:hypothetical protein
MHTRHGLEQLPRVWRIFSATVNGVGDAGRRGALELLGVTEIQTNNEDF